MTVQPVPTPVSGNWPPSPQRERVRPAGWRGPLSPQKSHEGPPGSVPSPPGASSSPGLTRGRRVVPVEHFGSAWMEDEGWLAGQVGSHTASVSPVSQQLILTEHLLCAGLRLWAKHHLPRFYSFIYFTF